MNTDYKQKIIDLGWHTETIMAKNTITFRVMNGKRIFWHKVSKAELEANYYPEVVKNLIWHGLYEEILKQL